MAGTRLVVHATFAIELFALVIASFLYASNQRHDPFSSAEPFLADKSGWNILVEDVSPAPSPDDDDRGIVGFAGEYASAVISQINSLTGAESEKVFPHRPRRASKFVQDLRGKISEFPFVEFGSNGGEGGHPSSAVHTSIILPPLRVDLRVPQVDSSSTLDLFSGALERGFQSKSRQRKMPHSPAVSVRMADSTTSEVQFNISDSQMCDNFELSEQSKPKFEGSYRTVDFPEIIILMGCSSVAIPDGRISSLQVIQSSGQVVIRTLLTVDQQDELLDYLEKDLASALSEIVFVSLAANNGHRVGSVSIELIDENPESHVTDGVEGLTAKEHFDIVGKSLSSSVQSTISSLLEDLSFLYGGKLEANDDVSEISRGSVMKANDAISLGVQSSAYLSLPDEIVESEKADDGPVSTKRVSDEGLANWIHSHSRQHNDYGSVEWVLFVPSQDNTPLAVHDKIGGRLGDSIILSPPSAEEARPHTASPNGISIVNFPSFVENVGSNANEIYLDNMRESYKEKISQSLTHLVGYIRAIHGLPPQKHAHHASSKTYVENLGDDFLSFWELESIARSYYSSSLELAFSKTDTLMALLHQHGGTIAFPDDVAHKLNTATHLLRESISLIEKGFPTIYATALLHGSMQYLDSVQNDHRFIELPHFATDHYLAVFSPLVLPLMLPMILGLVREVKRFKELRDKANKR